jgi:hypothetical protein
LIIAPKSSSVHASSMCRVSHYAVLLLAFWGRNPCMQRVVRLFCAFCRFWTQEGGTVSQIRTQIGMFRPIRMDHTNCLQVAIKSIQFQFLLLFCQPLSVILAFLAGASVPADEVPVLSRSSRCSQKFAQYLTVQPRSASSSICNKCIT